MLTDANRKVSIIAYYLSKFNMDAVHALGRDTYTSVFESVSTRFGKSNNYMKLRRDEFDVFMGGTRKGWHNRTPKAGVIRLHDELSHFSFEELTAIVNTLLADNDEPFIVPTVSASERQIITDYSENEIEQVLNYRDTNARIERRTATMNTRILDRRILDSLKELYHYRCQICGATATVMYGVDVSEAHHIDYFTHSMNNSPKNIVVLCPDHHRVVHKAMAIYSSERHQFEYENAKVDHLMLNLHL